METRTDDWAPPAHGIRPAGRPAIDVERPIVSQPSEKWQAFGQAVLAFHHRVALTAMCRCGRTVIECDVLAQARAHGLLPSQ